MRTLFTVVCEFLFCRKRRLISQIFTVCCDTHLNHSECYESSRGLFSSMTQGSLCGPQKKIGGLIKGALGSAEWRIVMEKLDSVNVFIFSVLKFKKWNPSLAPGCALSCLKRSDYLLRVCKGGLEGLPHQLITKQQRDAVHLFFLVEKKKITDTRDAKLVPAKSHVCSSPRCTLSSRRSHTSILLFRLWVMFWIINEMSPCMNIK